jgi:ABC-2 type transport system permease protein
MTTMVPELPRTLGGRLRGMLTDAGTVAWRDLIHWRRDPARIWGSLLYTGISVLLFGYVFGSAMAVPGGGNYRVFLMPGMFAMTMMFGIGETATGVATDAAKGVTDRFRSMPMSQVGVVSARPWSRSGCCCCSASPSSGWASGSGWCCRAWRRWGPCTGCCSR